MIKSMYLTDEETVEMKEALGEEMGNLYINWSNLYTMIHTHEWCELSGKVFDEEIDLDEEDLELVRDFIADKFQQWLLYHGFIEE